MTIVKRVFLSVVVDVPLVLLNLVILTIATMVVTAKKTITAKVTAMAI